MRRTGTILGGLAAGCAAWLVISSMRDIRARQPPSLFSNGNACDREFEARIYQSIRTANWFSVLSGLGCAATAVGILKMQSNKVAYGGAGVAMLAGLLGIVAIIRTAMMPCSSLNTTTATPASDAR